MLRKGRCARLKPDADAEVPTVPWFWDSTVRIAVASGAGCFVEGKQYEHGGVSPQECVLPVVTVSATRPASTATLDEVTWVGLRCRLIVSGAPEGSVADLRSRPVDPSSTMATKPAEVADGKASLLAFSDDHEGTAAMIVIVDTNGRVVAQQPTIVGGTR